MDDAPRRCPQGHLEGVVNAPRQLMKIAIRGIRHQTRHKKVREGAMDVHTRLLTARRGAKHAQDGHLLQGRRTEVRETNVEAFQRSREVVVYLDDTTTEDAGRKGERAGTGETLRHARRWVIAFGRARACTFDLDPRARVQHVGGKGQ